MMKIYLNGKFVKPEEAKISIFAPGFLYGQGLFETMRAYNERIFRLDSHIERLLGALPLINIKSNLETNLLKEAVNECLKKNGLRDGYVRLTVWQGESLDKADPVRDKSTASRKKDVSGGVNVAILAKSYNFFQKEDYKKGFRAGISNTFRQNELSVLSRVKSANYLNLLLAYQEARQNNYDEALLLNSNGFLAEATRANIFIVKDNCLITPSLDSGCLAGITRDTVFAIARKEKIEAIETEVRPVDLKKCDEAFLTNSLIEVMPLVAVDNEPIKKASPGKITGLILKRYCQLIG